MTLVSTDWLAANMNNKKWVILDASMQKVVGKTPIEYPSACYIPGSHPCCLETVFRDLSSSLANTFPTEQQFNQGIQSLGLDADSTVVIYDNQGIYSAPRAWWIFKSMGFEKVYVLDGGLPKWLSENKPVVAKLTESTKQSSWQGQINRYNLYSAEQILSRIDNHSLVLFDARTDQRFLGLAPEPRAGMRSGHIPSSVSLPFTKVLNGHCFKSKTELIKVFESKSDSETTPWVFSCGSGITACITLMAAHIAGVTGTALYDGSWAEWGAEPSLPLAL